jgi:protein transport protein SEC61 subunit gamma and related proteins
MEIADISSYARDTVKSWERVLRLSRKPRRQEFIAITKVTGLGTIIVGLMGFAIRMIVQIMGRVA